MLVLRRKKKRKTQLDAVFALPGHIVADVDERRDEHVDILFAHGKYAADLDADRDVMFVGFPVERKDEITHAHIPAVFKMVSKNRLNQIKASIRRIRRLSESKAVEAYPEVEKGTRWAFDVLVRCMSDFDHYHDIN